MLPFDPLTLKNTEKYDLSKYHFQNFPTFDFSYTDCSKTPKNMACLNPTFDFSHPNPPKTPKNMACLNPTFDFSHPHPPKTPKNMACLNPLSEIPQ